MSKQCEGLKELYFEMFKRVLEVNVKTVGTFNKLIRLASILSFL